MANKIIVPNLGQGHGGGHFQRAMHLATLDKELYIWIKDLRSLPREMIPASLDEDRFISGDRWNFQPELILLDQRKTSHEIYSYFKKMGYPLLGLDEGGVHRKNMNYLIDTLPNLKKEAPNLSDRGLLLGDKSFQNLPWDERKPLLISFGNEDPMDLTQELLDFLKKNNLIDFSCIHVVIGPLFKRRDFPGIQVIEAPSSLNSLLGEFKRVICSFGISAFEARQSNCQVALLNPSSYHDKLGAIEGFPSLGIQKVNAVKAQAWFLGENKPHTTDMIPKKLHELLQNLSPQPSYCNLCGKEADIWDGRLIKGSFLHCDHCRNISFMPWLVEEQKYDEDYFFSDYKKQYGKTYLEDFEHIQSMGSERVKTIEKWINGRKSILTDLGCAYGPFLKAAMAKGFLCRGVDISEDAVAWVKEKLKLEAWSLDLLGQELDEILSKSPSDCLSMWYVIEHFQDQEALWTRLNRWLLKDGILALSTPNGSGGSARKNKKRFYENNPLDHYVIFTVNGIKRILKRFGFVPLEVKITGNHPERLFPRLYNKKFFKGILNWLSPKLGWGDTFEIYARKVKEL